MSNQPTNHNLTSAFLPNNNTMSQVRNWATREKSTRDGKFCEQLVMVAGSLVEMDGWVFVKITLWKKVPSTCILELVLVVVMGGRI